MSRLPVAIIPGFVVALLPGPAVPAWSAEDDSALCLQAASAAAKKTGVPYDVLLAISVIETGRDGKPWPWTVNVAGESHWSKTRAEAAGLVDRAIQSGQTNVDLGCFQLNLYWHAQAFLSAEDMLDPRSNASYAAEFLASKYSETGDWSTAAAAFHSATPEYALPYQSRVKDYLTAFDDGKAAVPPGGTSNRFPLLIAGVKGNNGSLVPATAGGPGLLSGD